MACRLCPPWRLPTLRDGHQKSPRRCDGLCICAHEVWLQMSIEVRTATVGISM
jgi:hypothetical protein